jgi:hypothetical protein
MKYSVEGRAVIDESPFTGGHRSPNEGGDEHMRGRAVRAFSRYGKRGTAFSRYGKRSGDHGKTWCTQTCAHTHSAVGVRAHRRRGSIPMHRRIIYPHPRARTHTPRRHPTA